MSHLQLLTISAAASFMEPPPIPNSDNCDLDEDLGRCKLRDIGVRLNEKEQIEKHCNRCRTWISLGKSKGDAHAFREHYGSKTCNKGAKRIARILNHHALLSESPIAPANEPPPSPSPFTTAPRVSDEESVPTESIACSKQGSSCFQCRKAISIGNMRQHVGGHILQSIWGVREGDLLAEVCMLNIIVKSH